MFWGPGQQPTMQTAPDKELLDRIAAEQKAKQDATLFSVPDIAEFMKANPGFTGNVSQSVNVPLPSTGIAKVFSDPAHANLGDYADAAAWAAAAATLGGATPGMGLTGYGAGSAGMGTGTVASGGIGTGLFGGGEAGLGSGGIGAGLLGGGEAGLGAGGGLIGSPAAGLTDLIGQDIAGVDPLKVAIQTGTGYLRGGDTGAALGGLTGITGGIANPGGNVNFQDLLNLGLAAGGIGTPSPAPRIDPTFSPPISGLNIPGMGINPGDQPRLGNGRLDIPQIGGLPGLTLPGFGGLNLDPNTLTWLQQAMKGWGQTPNLNLPGGTVPQPPISTGGFDWSSLLGKIPGLGAVTGGIGGLIGGARKAFGGTNDLASNLGLMSGLGLLGAGLAQNRVTPDLETLFYGAPAQAKQSFDEQQAAETARRQAAEDQYLGRRPVAQKNLEDILGQDTQRAISRGVQTQEEKLNRQGLLGGPSGALNEAVARVSGDVRQSQLPSLIDFANQTETGLNGLRGGALTGDISLGRAGLDRQSTLQDQQRQATLRQRLLEADNKNKQRSDLLNTGGTLAGYGLGGAGGAQVGSAIGRSLESILG